MAELFRKATKLDKEDGEVQVSSLVYAMGREASKIFKSFTFAEPTKEDPVDPREDHDTAMTKFEAYFIPKKNVIYEKAKFYQRNQASGEPFCVVGTTWQDTAISVTKEKKTFVID